MKHTKGPWNVVPNDRRIVATNIQSHKDGGYTWDTVIETNTETNAHPIAAAPELLAFIKHVLNDQEAHGKNQDYTYTNTARALIAKAQGES